MASIIFYGAGQIGQVIVNRLKKNNYCNIFSWVDRCGCDGNIKNPESIADMQLSDYDYVVLATIQPEYAKEMEDKLRETGVPKERIIPCNCGC